MNTKQYANEKFKHIAEVLCSDNFRKRETLAGEVPFWIAPYPADAQVAVDAETELLLQKLRSRGLNPLCLDLFELCCQIAEEHVGLEKLFAVEQKRPKEKFKRALQSTVNVHERLVPAIVAAVQTAQPDMLLLKGVGAVYPFIRSHTVLNNLQSAVREVPTLLFFPGTYSGQSLNLFGLLKDDNYYRAFNIDQHKL
jgi:hypothetical protein